MACLIEHKGLSLQAACDEVILRRILKIGGDGGLIAVNSKGDIAMPFNTEGMYRACRDSDGDSELKIYK